MGRGSRYRSIKSTMRMDILRCKTPAMVEKEIWAHLLAYNLLRTSWPWRGGERRGAAGAELQGSQADLTAFAPKLEAARRSSVRSWWMRC
jgi:hypothetical protein